MSHLTKEYERKESKIQPEERRRVEEENYVDVESEKMERAQNVFCI